MLALAIPWLAAASAFDMQKLVPRPLAVGELAVGKTVVPTLFSPRGFASRSAFREARAAMFAAGLYPGVDYCIEQILRADESTLLSVRPAYPLIEKLEREWPVTVNPSLAPRWVEPASYNALTAVFAALLGVGWVATGALLATFLTLSVIPSDSMVPTVQRRDVLLVEKLSARLPPPLSHPPKAGDLVFFRPPSQLRDIVARTAPSGTVDPSALFVKRVAGVARSAPHASPTRARAHCPLSAHSASPQRGLALAAVPGDTVTIFPDGGTEVNGERRRAPVADRGSLVGSLVTPASSRLQEGEYFVLGDNEAVSIDGRCWGVLRAEEIAGRPLLRALPISRFGRIE